MVRSVATGCDCPQVEESPRLAGFDNARMCWVLIYRETVQVDSESGNLADLLNANQACRAGSELVRKVEE